MSTEPNALADLQDSLGKEGLASTMLHAPAIVEHMNICPSTIGEGKDNSMTDDKPTMMLKGAQK